MKEQININNHIKKASNYRYKINKWTKKTNQTNELQTNELVNERTSENINEHIK